MTAFTFPDSQQGISFSLPLLVCSFLCCVFPIIFKLRFHKYLFIIYSFHSFVVPDQRPPKNNNDAFRLVHLFFRSFVRCLLQLWFACRCCCFSSVSSLFVFRCSIGHKPNKCPNLFQFLFVYCNLWKFNLAKNANKLLNEKHVGIVERV